VPNQKAGGKGTQQLILDLLKEVATESPSAMNAQDVIGPVLSVAFNFENDGSRTQLCALEIIQALAFHSGCIETMLQPDHDLISMMNILQQRMMQENKVRHTFAAGQALTMIRNASNGRSAFRASQGRQRLMTVLAEENVWGVDVSLRAQALQESLKREKPKRRSRSRATSRSTSRNTSAAVSRELSPNDDRSERVSSIGNHLRHLLPEALQKSLAPIARERASLSRESSASEHSFLPRSISPEGANSAATNAGWAPALPPTRKTPRDELRRRETAQETRERRALRRQREHEAVLGSVSGQLVSLFATLQFHTSPARKQQGIS